MKHLVKKLQARFDKMCATGKLYRVELTGREIWDLYMEGFGDDPIFRDPESSEHNCNLCKNFIRRYGNVVAITDDYKVMTMFEVKTDEEYQNSMNLMSKAIKNSRVVNVFFETYDELNSLPYEKTKKTLEVFQLGIPENFKRYTQEEADKFGVVEPGKVYTFHHLNLKLPTAFVDKTGKSIERIMGNYRDDKNVFQRAMEEIPLTTLELVRDLINQGSLLDGTTHVHKIEQIIPLKKQYDALAAKKRDNWCWVTASGLPFAKFKNELIGVLCSELAQGEEINKACQSWNKRVDPANYMKAVAPITENQKRMAQEFVEENGYVEAFDRRHATIDDIKATEIKHINVGDGKIEEVSIFDGIKVKKGQHRRNQFETVETVSIDKFMEDILPNCTSVEAFVENRHEGNFVNITTTNKQEAKDIFKWGNPYSWTYKGNLAGKSQIKEAVKSQGGAVDGVLRFSIMWADGDGDNSDLDAHCKEPNGFEIYFSSPKSHHTGGNLDIDITQPQNHLRKGKDVVENITFPFLNKMTEGTYRFFVHQYAARGSKGFKAEIEFDGELFNYEYNKPVRGNVQVAEVTLKNGQFTINHLLPATNATKEVYGVETNNFHKVNLVCLSPNHWGDNNTGNKHYFFMLDGCKTDNKLRGFHTENLKPDLAQHRKVLDVLGAVHQVEPSEKQLAGLGFNSTVEDEVVLKLEGNFKRTVKVKF